MRDRKPYDPADYPWTDRETVYFNALSRAFIADNEAALSGNDRRDTKKAIANAEKQIAIHLRRTNETPSEDWKRTVNDLYKLNNVIPPFEKKLIAAGAAAGAVTLAAAVWVLKKVFS